MKLVLLSDYKYVNTQDFATRLIELIGKHQPTVGYISSSPDSTRKFYNETKEYYSKSNLIISPYMDLEDGFDSDIIELIFQADAIHLSGGNTFRFLYWIVKRGLDKNLVEYINLGGVLIGVSAGSIVMTPDISESALCGDENYIGLKNTKGLGLVNFHYVPHASGNVVHKDVITKSKQDCSAILLCKDSDWVVIDGVKSEVYGEPKLIVNGEIVDNIRLDSYVK